MGVEYNLFTYAHHRKGLNDAFEPVCGDSATWADAERPRSEVLGEHCNDATSVEQLYDGDPQFCNHCSWYLGERTFLGESAIASRAHLDERENASSPSIISIFTSLQGQVL